MAKSTKQTKKIGSPGPGPGRPKKEVPFQIRMSDGDRAAWQPLADAAGMTLSQWIRLQCATSAGARITTVSVEIKTDYTRPQIP